MIGLSAGGTTRVYITSRNATIPKVVSLEANPSVSVIPSTRSASSRIMSTARLPAMAV